MELTIRCEQVLLFLHHSSVSHPFMPAPFLLLKKDFGGNAQKSWSQLVWAGPVGGNADSSGSQVSLPRAYEKAPQVSRDRAGAEESSSEHNLFTESARLVKVNGNAPQRCPIRSDNTTDLREGYLALGRFV